MKRPIFPALIMASLVATLASPAIAKEKDKPKEGGKRTAPITLAQCPAPVQVEIQSHKPTAAEIEAEQENGVITYDAKLTLPDGKRLKLLIAADGKVLESKEKKAK